MPETVVDYSYDQPVDTTTPPVKATNVLGRLAKATSPTSSVVYSYDDLGRANASVFTDRSVSSANIYVQKSTYHGDDSLQALDLLLPDNISPPKDEHVDYTYDSAGSLRSVKYQDGTITQDLFTTNTTTVIPMNRHIAKMMIVLPRIRMPAWRSTSDRYRGTRFSPAIDRPKNSVMSPISSNAVPTGPGRRTCLIGGGSGGYTGSG